MDRDPIDKDPLYRDILSLCTENPPGQRPPLDRDPLDRDPLWTDTPRQRPLDRNSPRRNMGSGTDTPIEGIWNQAAR